MKKNVRMLCAALLVSALAGGAAAQVRPRMPLPGEAPAGSPVAKYGWLKATDGYLRGSKSGTENIQLRGMSFFWSSAGGGGPYYNEDVVAWLAHDWQVDLVRAAMTAKGGEGGGNSGYCDNTNGALSQQALVRGVVDAAIYRGIYVIIDFHSHAAHQYTDCATKFFKDMVDIYGKYPNVIYEIYNEPTGSDWNAYKTYSNTVINTIRTAEASAGITENNNLIVVGTPGYSSQPNIAGDVTDIKNNVAYTLHFYAASSSHDGYRNNATAAMAMNPKRTVFVTEFGSCDYTGGGSVNGGATDTWLSFLSTNKISWAYWAITDKDEAAAIIKNSQPGKPGVEGLSGTSGSWARNTNVLSASGMYITGKFPAGSKKYTVTLGQPQGGTLTKEPNSDTYSYGTSVTLKAAPAAGWELQSWTGDAEGNNATISGNIKGINLDISAVFYNGGLVKNGHFTYATTSWSSSSNSALSLSQDNGELKATVVTPGTSESGIYFQQTGIKLTQGHSYRLTFNARGQSARSITPRITSSTGVTNYLTPTPENIGTTEGLVTRNFDFTAASVTNAVLRIDCGGDGTAFYIDNVKLVDTDGGTAALPRAAVANRTAWSVVGSGGKLRLSGPAEAGAKVSLYDARGKAVRSFVAKDGLALGAGMPAGSYIAVVRNGAGREVYRARVSLVR